MAAIGLRMSCSLFWISSITLSLSLYIKCTVLGETRQNSHGWRGNFPREVHRSVGGHVTHLSLDSMFSRMSSAARSGDCRCSRAFSIS